MDAAAIAVNLTGRGKNDAGLVASAPARSRSKATFSKIPKRSAARLEEELSSVVWLGLESGSRDVIDRGAERGYGACRKV